MFYYAYACWLILSRFRYYEPQSVNLLTLYRWLRQFSVPQRRHILNLFCQIIFLKQEEVRDLLVRENESLIKKLAVDGVKLSNIIYVQFDKAASSSPVMLNMLRDSANLERRGAQFLDANDMAGLVNKTFELGSGAIIYVDDFSGSGKQFIRSRKRVASFVTGAFSEFFLAPCMCEEAIKKVEEEGVQPVPGMIHGKFERPLYKETSYFEDDVKQELVGLCKAISKNAGLGFCELATMVILYRNAPNTVPLLFRGSLSQSPYFGIFPRHDDLPFSKLTLSHPTPESKDGS